MTMLEEFSHAPASVVDRFLTLDIKSLNPSKHGRDIAPRRIFGDSGARLKPKDAEEIIEARTKVPEIVSKSLSALKGLKAIRWLATQNDPEHVQVAVIESLGSLPHLADLHIDVETSVNIPPLHYLKNGSLLNLGIRHTSINKLSEPAQFMTSLATVLVHNPLLRGLELEMSAFHVDPLLPFHDLFRDVPPNTVQLRTLVLCGWSVQATPHLRSLCSIDLPCPWAVKVGQTQGSDPCEGLWRSLREAGSDTPVPLRHIRCSQVSEELLHLLRSESTQGLESLDVNDVCEDTNERSNQLARQFFEQAFHRHRGTLRILALIPEYTGDWTVGLGSLGRFDEYTQLTYLCVAFDPDEVRPGVGDNDVVVRFF
ncbi:hypothetical protein PM082_002530 [Marasmius tenuissimus]|nr:hypothetical protein PM082_002530 [Marasmius tenuissimus]